MRFTENVGWLCGIKQIVPSGDSRAGKTNSFNIVALRLLIKQVGASFIFPLKCLELKGKKKVEMRFIKQLLLILTLSVFCSVAASAQTEKEGKKVPKKPNPPVVIVNLDKKDNKEKPSEKEPKKPRTYIFGILRNI